MTRMYGRMYWQDSWVIDRLEPHVCLRLKAVFPRIPRGQAVPFRLLGGSQIDADLDWFMQRYPLDMSEADRARLLLGKTTYEDAQAQLEYMFTPDWKPSGLWKFRDGKAPYPYQAQAAELARATGRLLLLDDVGLGKSVSAIAAIANVDYLPAAFIVQAHLADQWAEYIHDYTHLIPHVIKGTEPYQLPIADAFIFKFSNIHGWVDYVRQQPFRAVVIDELQELRNGENTRKGGAATVFLANTALRMGLTATPVYNYGSEMWHVMQFMEPDCLGSFDDFKIEWCTPHGNHWMVKDPDALGTFLREQRLSLRRTEHDVGWQMPPINTLMHQVPLDEGVIAASESLAKSLAMKVMNGSFTERGQAARELDAFARHQTGVAKASYVAAFVRVLLEAGTPVLLAGWHRDVYDIWLKELAEFNPVLYTGSETASQKNKAKKAFMDGKTNLFIISIRSGAGLDGLQHRCHTAIVGELDWSPQVIKQFFGRLRRPGQERQVDAIILHADGGSDPVMIEVNGLKASQSHGIVDPGVAPQKQYSDDSRIKALAQAYLTNRAKAPAPTVVAPSFVKPVPPTSVPVVPPKPAEARPVISQPDLFA